MYNNRNIVLHELIGLRVRVIESRDSSQKGISGIVTCETKNTLAILTGSGERTIDKKISRFKFISNKIGFIVDGKEILFRSSERTEKGIKYYRRRHL